MNNPYGSGTTEAKAYQLGLDRTGPALSRNELAEVLRLDPEDLTYEVNAYRMGRNDRRLGNPDSPITEGAE